MPQGPIQTQPAGLLGVLQLKNMGRNPSVLADHVQSTIDLADLYLQSLVENQTPDLSLNMVAAAAGGFAAWSVPAIVPPGEMWRVWNYSALATCAAGDTLTGFRVLVRTSSAVTSQFARRGTDVASKVGAGRVIVGMDDFWMGPGSELGLFSENLATAGTIPALGWINFTRLPL